MAYDALIVGGGPAGTALAIHLANQGRDVTLVEKKREAHHKVCGEFLSREAIDYLVKLGVDPVILGAVPITTVRLIHNQQKIQSTLPFPALSLSRHRLDEFLLLRASTAGANILRGISVESLQRSSIWKAHLSTGEDIEARDAFLATGKHDLRGWRRPPGRQNDLVAFKMHWHLTEQTAHEIRNSVELMLFPGGYCGLQLIEEDVANLCLLVRRDAFRKFGSSWDTLLDATMSHSPHLASRFEGAIPLWPQPLSVSSIPYGHIHKTEDDLWHLGDQMAVIGSFSGDGISIALHSAAMAASFYLAGGRAEEFHQAMRQSISKQVSLATHISRALVAQQGQALIGWGCRLMPKLLKVAASATRIPSP